MKTLTIVTGNPGKLRDIQALAPTDMNIRMVNLDLPEIQSMDSHAIIKDKLERAYKEVGSAVIVEDVSAGLDDLSGLPGPFFKFFEEVLGKRALLEISNKPNAKVTITCYAGYFDGDKMIFAKGTIHGTVVEPRGENGFGFDFVFVPDGHKRTMAEMTIEEKNAISHRGIAYKNLLRQIQQTIH